MLWVMSYNDFSQYSLSPVRVVAGEEEEEEEEEVKWCGGGGGGGGGDVSGLQYCWSPINEK